MVRLEQHKKVAVVGLGNVLLTDDGVGVHAVRKLAESPPQGATVAEIGTAVLGALDLLESMDSVIAIDAVKAGGPPGAIYSLDVRDACQSKSLSLHDHGIVAALQHLSAESRPQVTILGIEPEAVTCGMELSSTVEAVLPQVVEIATAMVELAVKHQGHASGEIPDVDNGIMNQGEFDHDEM